VFVDEERHLGRQIGSFGGYKDIVREQRGSWMGRTETEREHSEGGKEEGNGVLHTGLERKDTMRV